MTESIWILAEAYILVLAFLVHRLKNRTFNWNLHMASHFEMLAFICVRSHFDVVPWPRISSTCGSGQPGVEVFK